MDDEREEVHQNPLRPVVAFDVRRAHVRALQRLLDRIRDRLHLPRVLAGADQKEVGECRRVAQVEHDDVLGLLVERRLDRRRKSRRSTRLSAGAASLFTLGHATDLPERVDRDRDDGYAPPRAPARARESLAHAAIRSRTSVDETSAVAACNRKIAGRRDERRRRPLRMRVSERGQPRRQAIELVAGPGDHDERSRDRGRRDSDATLQFLRTRPRR